MSSLIDYIKDIKDEPLEGISFLFAVICGFVTLITGIVSTVLFGIEGGFSEQLKNGIFSISKDLTAGKLSMMYSGITLKAVLCLLIIIFLLMLVVYFIDGSLTRKILMGINFCGIIAMIIYARSGFWKTFVNEVLKDGSIKKNFLALPYNIRKNIIVFGIIAVVLLAMFLVLVLTFDSSRTIISFLFFAALFSFILIPLFFALVQNLFTIVGILLFVLMIYFALRVVTYLMSDHPEDLDMLKKDLKKTKEDSRNCKDEGNRYHKKAVDGGGIFISADTYRDMANKDYKKAGELDKHANYLERKIERIEEMKGGK